MGVKMAVELLDDKKRWYQFVETSPYGSHKWDFLKTVERHSGSRKDLSCCVNRNVHKNNGNSKKSSQIAT